MYVGTGIKGSEEMIDRTELPFTDNLVNYE